MVKAKHAAPPKGWDINIVGHDIKPASWFLANEKNFRVHPTSQQAATKGSLDELGWIDEVMVNRRSGPEWGADQHVETLINGHLRITLALREGDETPIPLKYVDLSPEKEAIALAVFDEITSQAMKDREKLAALIADAKPQDAALRQMLSEMAVREGLMAPDVEFKEYDESVADEVKYLECPECHHRWPA